MARRNKDGIGSIDRRTKIKIIIIILKIHKVKMPTASRIPKRSPIQVLTGPDAA